MPDACDGSESAAAVLQRTTPGLIDLPPPPPPPSPRTKWTRRVPPSRVKTIRQQLPHQTVGQLVQTTES